MDPHHSPRVSVTVAGQKVEANLIRHSPERFQGQLVEARERYGSARCDCRVPPLQLVIRNRGDKLFLAAWPNDSHSHALDCPFYAESDTATGAAAYAQPAIRHEGHQANLHLSHPLVRPGRGAPRAERPRQQARDSLHLWGLLHHLWESAALNRWHAGWRRDWGFARAALRGAAKSTTVDGEPLLDKIFVPTVYDPARQQELKEYWARFCEPLRRQHRGCEQVRSGFVIGTPREVKETAFGVSMRLRGLMELFYLSEALVDNLARFSRAGWSAFNHADEDDPEPHRVVCALKVEVTDKGKFIVVDAVLMRVTSHWIPVDSSYEATVARLLVQADRSFVRPLRYDNHRLALPHFVLCDGVGHDRIAMAIYGTGIPNAAKLIEQDRQRAAQMGMGWWHWDASQQTDPPTLPPCRLTPRAAARHVSNPQPQPQQESA